MPYCPRGFHQALLGVRDTERPRHRSETGTCPSTTQAHGVLAVRLCPSLGESPKLLGGNLGPGPLSPSSSSQCMQASPARRRAQKISSLFSNQGINKYLDQYVNK